MWRSRPKLRWKVPFAVQRQRVIDELRGKGWALWLRTVVMVAALPLVVVIVASWREGKVGPEVILWTMGLGLVVGTVVHLIVLAALFCPRWFSLYRGKLVIQSNSGTSVVRLDRVRFCEVLPLVPAGARQTELWCLRLFGESRRLLAAVPVFSTRVIEEVAAFLRESSVECIFERKAS